MGLVIEVKHTRCSLNPRAVEHFASRVDLTTLAVAKILCPLTGIDSRVDRKGALGELDCYQEISHSACDTDDHKQVEAYISVSPALEPLS